MIFIKKCIGFALYYVSFLVPRSKNKIVFGSSMGVFNDNPKYLYLFMLSAGLKFNLIWITPFKKDIRKIKYEGVQIFYKWSFLGLFHSLTSRYYIINSYVSDVNFYTSGGVYVINLWHGIGLKRIEFNINEGPLVGKYKNALKNRFLFPEIFIKPNKFLSTSKLMSEKTFCPAFRIDRSDCLELGYPRTDMFFQSVQFVKEYIDSELISKELIDLIEQRFSYIYMPTWRDVGGDFIELAGFDFSELNELMDRKNSIFILKLHPNTNINTEKLELLNNIYVIPSGVDVYPILPLTNVLITDYSSIFYDYLLLKNKGILLFPFDYDSYVKGSRDFILDYYEYTQSKCAFTFDELYNFIKQGNYTMNSDLKELRKKFWGNYTGNASSEITNYIRKNLI